MAVGDKERVSHVIRRLSMGVGSDTVERVHNTDDAIAVGLDLSAPAPKPIDFPIPQSYQEARNVRAIAEAIAWWVEQMRTSPRLIEERLVWFWHDHFASSVAKVRVPYLMWQQHLTIRQHATGSFVGLLKAISKDPAMLIYLDGVTNSAKQVNENFGREVLELFTLGRNNGYTQQDVVQGSRAYSGWIVNVPGRVKNAGAAQALAKFPPWSAVFVPQRHDSGRKAY